MTNELKPCPFCGGEAEIVDVCNDCFISGKVGVGCSKCPVIIAEYGEYKVFDSEAEAIAAWNTRAERTCELEINIDMTAVVCTRCGYEMPKGTKLHEVNYCLSCGAKVVDE